MRAGARGAKALALAAAVAVAGCAGGQSWTGDWGSAREATLQVSNHNWLDMTVYAVRGGIRVRLGTVETNRTRTFVLPRSLLASGELRLVGDPIGSRTSFESYGVVVSPGQAVVWNIENGTALSSVVVF